MDDADTLMAEKAALREGNDASYIVNVRRAD
jgi:hypothetical protein